MNRRLITGALALVLALTGCAELPRPVAEVETPRPAMTLAEAQRFHRTLVATLATSDRTRNATLAGEVLAGPDLSIRRSEYARGRLGGTPKRLIVGDVVVAVHAQAADSYPRRAVIVTRVTPTAKLDDDRGIFVVERSDASSGWRRLFGVTTDAATLRGLAVPVDGITAPAPSVINGIPLTDAGPLARAIENPARNKAKWAQTTTLTSVADDVRTEDRKKNLAAAASVTPERAAPAVIPTADGGAVVLASVGTSFEWRYVGDGYVYFDKGSPMARRFPERYDAITFINVSTYLYRVPTRGKVTATDAEGWNVDVTVGELSS